MATKKPSPYGSKKFTNIDEYHASFPPEIRKKLEEVRQAIRKGAPRAEESIGYNMPAFRQHKNLVYYAAFRDHISLFPTATPFKAFEKELAKFRTSKGTIQFPYDRPIPKDLVRRIVKYRAQEDEEKAGTTIKKRS